MAYDFFEIPSFEGDSVDLVYADPNQPLAPAFVHYGYAVGTTTSTWTQLSSRRSIPLTHLRSWAQYGQRHPEAAARLQGGIGYVPGEGVLRSRADTVHHAAHTAMRLGALELIANIFSGRVTANDKDPFPHQLSLLQFMRAKQDHVERVLIADEVGLGKTIEVGLVLRDLLVARGTLDNFLCVYLTSGGLVEDAAEKLRSVLRGAVGDQNIVSEVDSFLGFGEGASRGVHVASMHAARLYTDQRKQKLVRGVSPDILIIDECHHCASDVGLAGARTVDRRNVTLTYAAAHQMITGGFWPESRAPRLTVLMSATPFRNTEQFLNLLRLLTHNVDGFDAYSPEADGRRLVDRLKAPDSRSVVIWRRQDDEAVHSWSGGRLFPNLRIVRPHRDEPSQLTMTPEYLTIIADIKAAIREAMRRHNSHFGGFAIAQLEKKLTSSSIAGACYLFTWCVRHSSWPTLEAYRRDISPATESLRKLLIEISQSLASFDTQNTARHAEVYLPSDGFRFGAQSLAQGGGIPDIFRFHAKLEEGEDDEARSFLAAPEEIQQITDLGLRLLGFSQGRTNGVENAKLRWLDAMLAMHPESRFLVFTESLQTCAIIQSTMPRYARTLTGEMGSAKRDAVVAEFRDPASSVRVLVATSAADEGFDLQVSNRVVHWDLSSSPAVLMQRNGRVARLGQIADVTAYYLILPGTHEERRDSALVDRFGSLGIDDVRLQLKILGTLTEEQQGRLDEAIDVDDVRVVGEILTAAQRDNADMDRRLKTLSTELRIVSVLDRNQLADRLEAWTQLGLPDNEDVDLAFSVVAWNRPVFGERTTTELSHARTARITRNGSAQNITFDPEFKLFSAAAERFQLAGLRPWTNGEHGQQMKIRPDGAVDLLGALTASLARLPRADFATVRAGALAGCIPPLAAARYLLFATHPMREAETASHSRMAPYLTFYAFGENGDDPLAEGSAADVHALITMLEREATTRPYAPSQENMRAYLHHGERLRKWLVRRTQLGGTSLFGAGHYALPVPVALVAVVGEPGLDVAFDEGDRVLPWAAPCVAMFEHLAETDPTRLIRMISAENLSPPDLTFAAEVAGKLPGDTARAALLSLLSHPSALVREGAVYGLRHHRSAVVDEQLRALATRDDSAGVREAAHTVLEDA